MIPYALSRRALKDSELGAIAALGGNLFHWAITATLKRPAEAAFAAVGSTLVKVWPLIDRPFGID